VTILARVGNGGANVAAAPVNVAFYDASAGGTLLGVVQTTQNLAPGQWEDVALVLAGSLPTPLTICAVADDDGEGVGKHNECNEQNNSCCRRFDAFCGCVDDLTARAKPGKVQLVWTHSGAHHYNVYRGTISGGPYLKIASTSSTYSTYLDEGLVNGTTYYYVVREATSLDAEFCQSNEASARPTATRR
jgi:hypothetical protein